MVPTNAEVRGGERKRQVGNAVSSGLVVRLFTAAFLLTVVTLCGLIWYTWHSYKEFEAGQERIFKTVELTGSIVHLDEVLTMSARMAAATGDLKWEERYREFEPLLDSRINEAMALWPDVFISEAVSQTNLSNIKLVEMENKAFDYVRDDNNTAAQDILYSDAYQEQKRIYSNGMEQVTNSMHQQVSSEIVKQRGKAVTTISFLVLLVIVTVSVWIYSLFILRRFVDDRTRY